MKAIIPEAVTMRSHGLYQANRLLNRLCNHGIQFDASLLMPHATELRPFKAFGPNGVVWRIPSFFEDDLEGHHPEPLWNAGDVRLKTAGLKVFNFHPVHIALNSSSLETYEALKRLKPLPEWTPDFIAHGIRVCG